MSTSACKTCKVKKCSECNRIMFPAPPVNTTYWGPESWGRYISMYGVDREPLTIVNSFGTWIKLDKTNEQGEALYTLK